MFYLTSKFHDNSANTFGFMEGDGALKPPPPPHAQELQKRPGGIRLRTFYSKSTLWLGIRREHLFYILYPVDQGNL